MAISLLRLDMRSPAFSKASTQELYAAALDMATWADEQGFNSIVLSEHHGVEDGFLCSPIAFGGAVVGRTRNIGIAVMALLVPLYDPVKLAEDLAILDLASGGRFGITAGIGYRPEEYSMMGRDWATRGKQMDECLDVIVRAWKGEPFDWNGRRVHLTPRPITQPLPPIMVGGTGRNAARRAARLGLGFQPALNNAEAIELYYSECARLGVENPLALPPGAGQMTWVSEDPERTWAEIGPYLFHDASTYASWQPEGHSSAVHSRAGSVEELRSEGKYRVLTPDECVAESKTMGNFPIFMMYPLCGGTPPELGWQSLELYASKVLPRLTA